MISLKHALYGLLFTMSLNTYAATDTTPLAVWANEAIVATYTYNDQNFLARQQAIAHYFTSAGWIAYSKALHEAKLPETVHKNNYDVSAVATAPPIVTSLSNNSWQAVMPLLVLYKNPQYQQKQTLEVTLEWSTTPAGQGVRGFGITRITAKQVTPMCQCPADTMP